MSINPAYWILYVFTGLYFTITSGFSRIREVMADVMAIDPYGGEAFRDGLLKVATNDQVFSQIVHGRHVPALLQEGKTITNFSKLVESMYEQLDPSDVDELRADLLSQSESSSPYDSHPPLQVRVDYAGKFLRGAERDDRPVSVLFDDWD